MGEGVVEDGSGDLGWQWGFYLQPVLRVLPRTYLVGRYEHFDQRAPGSQVNLFVSGVAFKPVPYVVLKAEYLFADHSRRSRRRGSRRRWRSCSDMRWIVDTHRAWPCGIALLATAPHAAEPLAVIVHPSRSVSMSRAEVARIYLKKQRFWRRWRADRGDQPRGRESARVERFSERVFGAVTAHGSRAYWNEQYFQGIFPPATLSSGAAVKKYVASERNAIGYIDAGEVDDSVKVVLPLP